MLFQNTVKEKKKSTLILWSKCNGNPKPDKACTKDTTDEYYLWTSTQNLWVLGKQNPTAHYKKEYK